MAENHIRKLKTISDKTIFFLDPKEKERDNKRKLRYRR